MSDRFTYAVIGKAMEVHRELGPGLEEIFYQELLSRKLLAAGIPHLSKPRQLLVHRGMTADVFEPDFVFSGGLIGELKCLTGQFDGEHYVQLICYLKFWKMSVGLLFDFAKESLNSRRVQFSEPQFELPELEVMLAACPARHIAETAAVQVCEAIRQVLREHGLGYRDTTYSGLLSAELIAAGAKCACNTPAAVRCGDALLGETICPCLVVNESVGLRVLALRRNITPAEEAILRTYLRLLGLHYGLIVNFNRASVDFRWITYPYERVEPGVKSNLCPSKSLGNLNV
jgi:GxxExxY protein